MSWTLLMSLAGCGFRQMLPGTAVLGPQDLPLFERERPAEVAYAGPHLVDLPVLPLQVFGLHYAVDVVLGTRGTGWQMHEYARVDTAEGPVWIAKDSAWDGVQTIVGPPDEVEGLVPEVPIPRLGGSIQVEDRSTGDRVALRLAYSNARGQEVEIDYRGRVPASPPRRRNGNTMGHSRQLAAVVLDIARLGRGGRARVTIDGRRHRLRRLGGLVPLRFLLDQTQGGIPVTSYRLGSDGPIDREGEFTLTRPAGAAETDPTTGAPGWPSRASETWTTDGRAAWTDNGLDRFTYRFVGGGLSRATVHQVGREQPVFELWLDPALPDLSRAFRGTATSRFRMDVNGQPGHGTGTITARWIDDDTASLDIRPTAPSWLADRPLTGTIDFPGDGTVTVQVVRAEG